MHKYTENTKYSTFLTRTRTAQPRVMLHLQVASPPLFDLDSISKDREGAPEARTKGPVVEITKVRLEGGVDEPLIIFFG